jgi:cell division protein FtsB
MATLEDRVETVEAEYQRCVNWQLKAENRRLRQNIKELKTEHRDLIEDVEELRAENRSTRIGYYIQHSIHVNGDIWEQKQQVRRLEEDVERLKAESCEIQAENRNFKAQVQRVSPPTNNLNLTS